MITQTITELPPSPDHLTMSPDEFSLAGVNSLAAQKAMVPQINAMALQMNAVAEEINTEAAAVAADKALTQAAAATVSATANAAMWNAATNYAQGACVISPIDFATYRRKIAGTTAADPSADPVNWGSTIAGLTPLQQDRAALVAGAGMTPNANDPTQVLGAVQKLIEARVGDYALDTGVANAYVVALNPAITAYTGNFNFSFKAAHTGTGPGTIDFGAGPIPLVNDVGGALADGDIQAGMIVSGEYSFADGKAYINSMVRSQGDSRFASSQFNFGAAVAANALTGTLQPCKLDFRSATLTNGAPINYNLAAALSCVVPAGATLGISNGVAARLIWLVAFNAGTPVLCVVNLAGGVQLDETNLISPTTISAGATSAGVIYSASAVSANSPYKVVGITDITEAAAGTFTTAPTLVQGASGQVLAALSSLGCGQTWQDVTGSRAASTTYYNTTGKPIFVKAYSASGTAVSMILSVNGSYVDTNTYNGIAGVISVDAIIPPGASYSISVAGSIATWKELR